MKKLLCIFLSVFLLMSCIGCTAAISLPKDSSVRIVYNRGGVSFDEELSKEEAELVLSCLNGKRFDLDMTVTGAGCGFGREQYFVIDGIVYCLGQDGCGVVWEEGTDRYYNLSMDELSQLRVLFKARGAKWI